MAAPTGVQSVEAMRAAGVEAYARFHRAVSNPQALERYLPSAEIKDAAARSVTASLPQPVVSLPLRLLTQLAVHLQRGLLEWFARMGDDGSLIEPDFEAPPDYPSAALPLLRWLRENEGRLANLLVPFPPATPPPTPPWAEWVPPQGTEPTDPGRLRWGELTEVATETGLFLSLNAPTTAVYAFTLVREWSYDLTPLLGALGSDLDQVLDVLRGAMQEPADDPVAESMRAQEAVLAADVGLPTCSWTVFAVFVGAAGDRRHVVPALRSLLDPAGILAVLRRAGTQQEKRQPSSALVSDFWTTDDQLGHQLYADAIAEFIGHEDTRPPLTIGIKAPWGAGKTSLMRMVRKRLDPDSGSRVHLRWNQNVLGKAKINVDAAALPVRAAQMLATFPSITEPATTSPPPASQEIKRYPTVWFNAWMYQSSEQIWAGMAHEIIRQLTDRMTRLDREAFWLELNLRRIDRSAIRRRIYSSLLARALPVVAGLLLSGLVALVMFLVLPILSIPLRIAHLASFSTLGVAVTVAPGVIALMRRSLISKDASEILGNLVAEPGYEGRTGFLHLVQSDMPHVLKQVATEERPVVVFVDDLDRCSHSTVVQVIEAINLFLAGEFRNCVFILAIQPDIVAANIQVAYKDVLDILADEPAGEWKSLGWRFLEKMVQLPLTLPEPDDPHRDAYVTSLLSRRPPVPPMPPAIDQGRVRQYEGMLRAQTETVGDVSSAYETLQQAATTSRGDDPLVASEVATAAENVFSQVYRDDDPDVQKAVHKWAMAGLTGNPRELKRFINLFRFYLFIQLRREVRGKSEAASLDQVAKVTALALRWPHLLGGLVLDGAKDGSGARRSRLGHLEDVIAAGGSNETTAWPERVKTWGYKSWHELKDAEELEPFLRDGPRIASLVEVFL